MGTHRDGYSDELANEHDSPVARHGEHRYLHSLAHHMAHRGYAGAPHVRAAAKHVADVHDDDGKPTKQSKADVDAHVAKHGLKRLLRHHAECHPPGSEVHKLLHAAASTVRESTMTDVKNIARAALRVTESKVNVLPDAATIEEAEVIHFHARGAALGSVHRWKDGLFRKTSGGWVEVPAPSHAAPAAVDAGPSKAPAPEPKGAPAAEPVAKTDAATHHEPKPEPKPEVKPAGPSKAEAPKAKVHAGTPHPAPEGVDPVTGPYGGPGTMMKHAEWARAIKPGHEIEARWTNSHNHYRARAVVTKVNDNSVRVRLTHPVGLDMYGSGLHGYGRGHEITVPLYSGKSLASLARHTHVNGAYPVSDKTPDADHSTHTHAVMHKVNYDPKAKASVRQTFPSKEAAEAAAAKANGGSGAKAYGFEYSVAELPEPITSPDIPVSDHKMVHSVFRNDGLEQERFGTEHAAREKVKAMNDYHGRSGLRFHYRRIDQEGLPRQGGAQVQAQADMNAEDRARAQRAHQAAAAVAHPRQLGGPALGADKVVAAEPEKEKSAVAATTHVAQTLPLGLPPLPPLSDAHKAKAEAERRSYGQDFDPAKEFAIQQPEDVPLTVAPKPADVPQALHDKLVSFAHHVRAADVADMVSGGFTHEVHKDSHHVKLHYKRGHAYVDVGTSGRYMIPTEAGKGKWASFPVGTVHAIRAYGQKHPFYTRGNVVDGSAQAKLAKDYDSVVNHGMSFRGVRK